MPKAASSASPPSTIGRSDGAAAFGLPHARGRSGPSVRPIRDGTPESLDFEILRECFGEGAGYRGFDPRRSPEVIARALRVSPATVRRRIASWRDRGFLLGYDVLPHPGLMGGRWAARQLDFQSPLAQERAIEALGLIDGVIQIVPARTTLLAVYLVEAESQPERRLRQLGSVVGVTEIGPELPFEVPACARRMTRADWRLVQALRRTPEAHLAQLAETVGQSTRTTSRRFDSLIEGHAVMFDPILDFSRFHQTLADLAVSFERPEIREVRERAVAEIFPQAFRAWGPPLSDTTRKEAPTVHYWVTAPTSAELDERVARVAHIPGVDQVFLGYVRSTLPVRGWLDERIESILKWTHPHR